MGLRKGHLKHCSRCQTHPAGESSGETPGADIPKNFLSFSPLSFPPFLFPINIFSLQGCVGQADVTLAVVFFFPGAAQQ